MINFQEKYLNAKNFGQLTQIADFIINVNIFVVCFAMRIEPARFYSGIVSAFYVTCERIADNHNLIFLNVADFLKNCVEKFDIRFFKSDFIADERVFKNRL